jgi:hypothetical protein
MLALAFSTLRRLILLVAIALSLTATGFAHRMTAPQDQAMALALANGAQAADFCGDAPDRMPGAPHCEACQIAASANLAPPPAALSRLALACVAKVAAPRESRAVQRSLGRANLPQGPPAA